jgi:CRISPR system Cascade subunit CasB
METKNSKKNLVAGYVTRKVEYLQKYRDNSGGKAALANLRHGIGRKPGEIPELWGMIFEDMPEELDSKGGEASAAEWAIYTALTLYALHQQSNSQPMHCAGDSDKGKSIGTAAAALVHSEDDLDGVLKRMNIAVTSTTVSELAYRLRDIVQFLRNEAITLDYGRLAADLYDFHYPESAERVKLQWGRDFYRAYGAKKNNNEKGE